MNAKYLYLILTLTIVAVAGCSSDTSPDTQAVQETTTTAPQPSTTTPPTIPPPTTQASTPPSIETELVSLRFESRIEDVSSEELQQKSLAILNDPRGWQQAGFTFTADEESPHLVVLAEGSEVDQLCLPMRTYSKVSCQNGSTVALNADRWRNAVGHWEQPVDEYRAYLVNHEVGHLIGQRHPVPRCPQKGKPAGVMEQQTAGLEGCLGNSWPRAWEIEYAKQRPVIYAPLPEWQPEPRPQNTEPQ